MKIALLSLPWSSMARPSAATAALAAYVERELPSLGVETFPAYLDVVEKTGQALYLHIAEDCYKLGELLYMPLLYPEKRDALREHVTRRLQGELSAEALREARAALGVTVDDPAALTDALLGFLESHLDGLARRLAGFDLIGLTTCFGQLFANVALCARVKQLNPAVRTLLGGSTISGRVGPAILAEYASVDFVIQGEGERPLVALLNGLVTAAPDAVLDEMTGVLTRSNAARHPDGTSFSEVADMDDLPIPAFDDYTKRATELGITWMLPIEGSRGCWWDRVKRSGDIKQTCYFCNLNVQWGGYRQKSEDRVVAEVERQVERYGNTNVFFLDNIIRHKGIEKLARGLAGLNMDLSLFYEMRANVKPHELLLMQEAGVRRVQFGIESLSSSLLKRIGKGTTTIQNFQAMKTCFELGISNLANLILDFPTSTEAEVLETCEHIRNYAICWQPLSNSRFHLGVGSTVETLRAEFNVSNTRNEDDYRIGLPEDVWQRVPMADLSYDVPGGVDWRPVAALCDEWAARHAQRAKTPGTVPMLCYQDGRSFLRIQDRRGRGRDHVLRGASRDVYLYCTQIRSVDTVLRKFARSPGAAKKLEAFLDRMVAEHLMFREGGSILAVAMAQDPAAAARRIRALATADAEPAADTPPPEAPAPARHKLPVYS